jgi:hypothetical protein
MNDSAAASDLALCITEHMFPFMRATPENAETLRLAAQRALDECWPGVWLACFRYFPPKVRQTATIAAVVIEREPNRMVTFGDDGERVIETDAEQERRMFGGAS